MSTGMKAMNDTEFGKYGVSVSIILAVISKKWDGSSKHVNFVMDWYISVTTQKRVE